MNLTVSKLANAAGVGVETIRFYQKRGLLPQPEAASGYRKYEAKDVARLQFIKRAKTIGFTLNEIGELIQLEQDASSRCGDVQNRAHTKVELIDEKIADLMRMREELVRLASCCAHDQLLSECRLTNCLAGECAN